MVSSVTASHTLPFSLRFGYFLITLQAVILGPNPWVSVENHVTSILRNHDSVSAPPVDWTWLTLGFAVTESCRTMATYPTFTQIDPVILLDPVVFHSHFDGQPKPLAWPFPLHLTPVSIKEMNHLQTDWSMEVRTSQDTDNWTKLWLLCIG